MKRREPIVNYGYVASNGGTFGTLTRTFVSSLTAKEMGVIRWNGTQIFTSVLLDEVTQLDSAYEREAEEQAQIWFADSRQEDLETET